MLVLRLGEVHEADCETLSTTTDWLPIDDFADESLDGMDLRCCPTCIDGPTGSVSVAELPRSGETAESGSEHPAEPARTVPQR